MTEYSKELIQDTIEVWSPKAGYTLSEDEAIEIITNLTNYFETLHDLATLSQSPGFTPVSADVLIDVFREYIE